MHLTRESDYAIRIVTFLASRDKITGARIIADYTDVTLRFSLKILHSLVQAKIVESFKGTNGGYRLAVDPERLTLYDVIFAIEGEFYINRCLSGDNPCSRNVEGKCKVHEIFEEVSALVREKLSAVTFSQLVDDSCK